MRSVTSLALYCEPRLVMFALLLSQRFSVAYKVLFASNAVFKVPNLKQQHISCQLRVFKQLPKLLALVLMSAKIFISKTKEVAHK